MNRNTKLYALASMINDMSSEILKSMVPVLVRSPVLAGIAGGAIEGLAEAMKFFWGRLSDYLGKRKPFILAGYLISGISRLLTAFLPGLLPFFIIFDRLGKSMRDSPRDASIAAEEKDSFLAFSFRRMMDNVGALAGVIIALLLYPVMGKGLLFLSASIGMLSFIPIMLSREVKARKRQVKADIRQDLLLALPFLGNASYVFFALAYPSFNPILIYAAFNLSYAFLIMPFSFERLLPSREVLGLGYAIFSLSLLMAVAGFSPLAAAACLGIGYGIMKNMSLKMAGRTASSIGAFQSLSGIFTIASNLFIGLAWTIFGKSSLLLPAMLSAFLGFLAYKQMG